jgi:hypothetical protein
MRALLFAALLAACTDVPQPFELDHARVMAVRVDPPSLAPGERTRIDVLVTDNSGPRVAPPTAFMVEAPPGLEPRQTPEGWFLDAPTTATSIVVPLSLSIDTAEGTLTAQKTVAFGAHADNPAAPEILLDGEARPLDVAPGAERLLSVNEPIDGLSYRWFSSVGDLVGYTTTEARLEPIDGLNGYIVLVVRDQAGGTAWTLSPAMVTRSR